MLWGDVRGVTLLVVLTHLPRPHVSLVQNIVHLQHIQPHARECTQLFAKLKIAAELMCWSETKNRKCFRRLEWWKRSLFWMPRVTTRLIAAAGKSCLELVCSESVLKKFNILHIMSIHNKNIYSCHGGSVLWMGLYIYHNRWFFFQVVGPMNKILVLRPWNCEKRDVS